MGKRTDGKAEVGRVREEKRREDQRRESQKKEGKPRNIVFFQWFVAPEGRKVGSPKQRVRSHLARWEMKNCTRCGTKHMWKSKCRKHLTFGPLLEVEMSKKCTPVWREAHFQVKMYKARHSRSTFGSWHVEKVHAIVARSTCPSQNVKNTTCSDHFWTFRCRFAWQAQGTRKWRLCGSSKSVGSRGTFQEGLQRYIFRDRRSARDMSIWDVRRSGWWFPERGCILEHQIFSFGKMILCDRCSTSYDLASFFRGRRSTLDRWSGQIARRIGTRPSALHSTFHFWRKSPRIASSLVLSSSRIEESRRIASFLTLSSWKMVEV